MATRKGNKQAMVVGVFEDRQKAQQAVQELRRLGFEEDQIGVASREMGGTPKTPKEGTYAEEGAAAGLAAGAGIGALWGLGILSLGLPAIGPAIAGGILGTLLSSAAAGAVAATLAGALIGLGIPEKEASYYDTEFKAGRTIVTVRADGRSDEAWAVLQRYGAYSHETRATAPMATSAACTTAGTVGERTMQLHEEQLHAHKQPVETGEVRVRKEVVTEHKTLDVPVQREEVVVERHPAGHRPASGADIRPGEEVRIPVMEEQVRVTKEPVVKEEVQVSKRKVQETERVAGTVRKEEVKVERTGDVNVKHEGRK